MNLTISSITNLVKEKVGITLKGDGKNKGEKQPEVDIFSSVHKTAILQEAKCFNDPQINDKKCKLLIARLIYLINQGEKFLEVESTSLFFSITKLFQSNNYDLRRMIYLMIKELRNESSIYIITSSLTKDMNSKIDLFRMNALRTIPIIIDPTNLLQIERYIKNAINDKNCGIANSALLSGLHIFPQNKDLVRKWSNEILEKLSSKYQPCHYHALILLHEIKKQDNISFIKVLVNLTKENTTNIATVQLIRFIKEFLINQDIDSASTEKIFLEYLFKQVHQSNEIVVFEACKALIELPNLSNKELAPALTTLMIFLLSSSSVVKFGALKIINKLISNPIRTSLLTSTNEIETILSDNNRSLSSLAISILLKVCKDENVEKLLNQIYEYLGDISDEFKIDIIYSVKGLLARAPKKYKSILNFLANCLKSESKSNFKKHCLERIEYVMNEVPDSKETAITHLVEYIEDCQYSQLHLYILSIITRQILAQNKSPIKYIRYILNRITLESNEVRTGAISALGKFALKFPDLHDSIVEILRSVANDHDEEVREQARYYLICLDEQWKEEENDVFQCLNPLRTTENLIDLHDIDVIEQYIHNNKEKIQNSHSIDILSEENIHKFASENKLEKKPELQEVIQEGIPDDFLIKNAKKQEDKEESFEKYKRLFAEHAVFSEYGPLFKICPFVALTDKNSEYTVEVQKFLFQDFIVLEYKIQNNLNNMLLKNVAVELTLSTENLKLAHIIPAPEIKPLTTSNIFVGLAKNPELKVISSNVSTVMKYEVNEINLSANSVVSSYEDEFFFEDFEISIGDYFNSVPLSDISFTKHWDSFTEAREISSTYQLNYKTVEAAIKGLIKHFGMAVCGKTDVIIPTNNFHTLLLCGEYFNGETVLMTCIIGFDAKMGCVLKSKVRSNDEELNTCLNESIG